MPADDESVIAFTRNRAAALSGLSERQLDYWRKTDLIEPSTSQALSPFRAVYLYGFTDMLELLTIAQLLERKVPTRRIRKIVDRMRDKGYVRPLSQIKYGVVEYPERAELPPSAKQEPGGERRKPTKRPKLLVVLTYEDGTQAGDDVPDQALLESVVDVREIRAALKRSTARDDGQIGRTEKRRGALGGKELFAGTRIPVDTVRRYLEDGAPIEEILEAFPALEAADVEAVRAS